MGWFDFLRGPGRKTPRTRRKVTGDEQLARERARAIGYVRRNFPDQYNRMAIALAEAELSRALGNAFQQQSEIQSFVTTARELRKAGLLGDPSGVADEGIRQEKLLDGLIAFAPTINAIVGRQIGTRQESTPPEYREAIAHPAVPPAVPPAAPQGAESGQTVQQLVNQIADLDPPAAASFLVRYVEQQPNAAPLIDELVKRPDSDIPGFLQGAATLHPVLRPLFDLYQSRPDWFMAVVTELRQRRNGTGPKPAHDLAI